MRYLKPFILLCAVGQVLHADEPVVLEHRNVSCEGTYRHHLQGLCTDGENAIFWSFTTTLVKTDNKGQILKKIPVVNHHGDLCHHNGKIYVAVNLGRFNDPQGHADSWVYVYNAGDLSLHDKHKIPEVFHGAGGIAFDGKRFIVVGGLPDKVNENYVYEYDSSFHFTKKHVIKSGHTHLGIQTAAYHDGQWWFGCYGDPKILLVTDSRFHLKSRFEFDCSLGVVGVAKTRFLVGQGSCSQAKGCIGSAVQARSDDQKGLVIEGQ